jgi:hypothetical protein
MALSDAEYDRLEAALADGEGLDPAYAAKARELLAQRKTAGPASVTPAPDNSLGVTGVVNQPEAPLSPEDSEVGRIAAALDPRFDLIPQGLALLPATNDPRGDQAAIHDYKAGTTGDVKYAYEPPVAVVQKQLLENPNMLGLLRGDPPSPEDIATMDASSPLYQDAANYMWARTAEDAGKKGHTVYRYSKLPWGNEDASFENLGLKLRGGMQPLVDAASAFVMGVDDIAALGAGRAGMETATPETEMHVPTSTDYMGLDEKVPQKTADLNSWNLDENPAPYVAGQVYGATRGWGAPGLVYKGILEGGGKLAQLIAKTRLGALATKAPAVAKGAAGLAGEVAAGTGEAVATQLGQEGVDAAAGAAGGREPVLGAGERILDTGESAALWGLGGGVLGRLAGGGANAIRNADRFGGAVGRTESSLSYGPLSPLLGPSLKGELKDTIRLANKEGNEAGDYLAERIAPPMREAAANRTRKAEGAERAEQANYQESELGREMLPVTGLQTASLEKLRKHHQPLPGGGLRAVDDKARDAQKVFNRHIDQVSLEPVEGAIKLTPDEAGTFLGSSARYKLVKDDIEAAAARSKGAVPADIKRDEYLQTVDSRKRKDVEEEIDAAIDDILGDRAPTPAARAKAEQRVLHERVEEESFAEANGPLGDYLRQRGVDAVYVTPAAYDAKRTDTLIEGLTDKELLAAAKHDRAQRIGGGERGGYSKMRDKHEADVARAKATEESIAPKGSAFEAVASHANKRPGDKERADELRSLADESGTRGELDQLRNLTDARNIQRQAWFRSPKNSPRGFGMQNVGDAAMRALEPGGNVTGGQMSRMALMGQIEDESARQAEQDKARPAYEKRRAEASKQKDAEREKAKKERERRRTEKHRDD